MNQTTHINPADLDPDTAKFLLLWILESSPSNVNPTNQWGGCLYTDEDDSDRHCVVGQLAAELGWPVPPASYRPGVEGATKDYWPDLPSDTAQVLWRAQAKADYATRGDGSWGTAAKALRNGWGMAKEGS